MKGRTVGRHNHLMIAMPIDADASAPQPNQSVSYSPDYFQNFLKKGHATAAGASWVSLL